MLILHQGELVYYFLLINSISSGCLISYLAPKSNCKTVQGMLISDWEALDRLYSPHGSNYRESILRTINAGIDMVDETQTLYLDITFSQSSTSLILFPGDGAI